MPDCQSLTPPLPRRRFLQAAGAAALAGQALAPAQGLGEAPRYRRPEGSLAGVEILTPRMRVPLSFIIDDSTCLVNMGHYCMPQFATAWPERESYRRPWRSWPREIPDAFVREFGEFCADHDVRGKYSVVPYPACVGWVDRELPGWSRSELQASLQLVRDLIAPRFDIHPEMITHTRVIDLKTGCPLEEISPATMENSYPRTPVSVDHLASYLSYSLRILRNAGLDCEGVTTPGGFGNLVKSELSLAARQAVQDVFRVAAPHYFKYVVDQGGDTAPRLEHVRGVGSDNVEFTVNIPAATGDWFGGWDGVREVEGDRYANADATAGRMVELIELGQPAIMLCHWPGLYNNGGKQGLKAFQQVVLSLQRRYAERTQWMKLAEIARYWAAKELTAVSRAGDRIQLTAPVGCEHFTLRIPAAPQSAPQSIDWSSASEPPAPLRRVERSQDLAAKTWRREQDAAVVCVPLAPGKSELKLRGS